MEKEFQLDVIELAHHYGWRAAHFKAAMMPDGSWLTPVQADGKGLPDMLLVRNKAVIWAELKIDITSDLRDEQIEWLCLLGNGNRHVYVWTPEDWEKINFLLRETV